MTNVGVPSSSPPVFVTPPSGDKNFLARDQHQAAQLLAASAVGSAPSGKRAAATAAHTTGAADSEGEEAKRAKIEKKAKMEASEASEASDAGLHEQQAPVAALPANVPADLASRGRSVSPAALPELASGRPDSADRTLAPPLVSLASAPVRHDGAQAMFSAAPGTRAAFPFSQTAPDVTDRSGGRTTQSDPSAAPASPSDRKREQSPQSAAAELARPIGLPVEKFSPELQAAANGAAPPVPPTNDLRAMGAFISQGAHPSHRLLELAADDPSLHAAALGKNAHVRLETGKEGELSMHLTVRDGVVDVRFDGSAARTLDIRSHEVRAALAGEGIALGSFESTSRAAAQVQSAAASANAPAPGDPSNNQNGGSGVSSGGAGSSHAGSQFGGGARHSEAGDRWPDREPPQTPGLATPGQAQAEPRRRRGFHVTA